LERIIFMGTPQFAVVSLRKLVESGYNVVLVVTQPDNYTRRFRKTNQSEVKRFALDNEIEVFEPKDLKSPVTLGYIKSFRPDLIIVVAYGKILPQSVLDIPRIGCINVHASLLPRWRGASPIQLAIMSGDVYTGVTIIRMDSGMDTGDVLFYEKTKILDYENAKQLSVRLSILGADLLLRSLEKIFECESLTPFAFTQNPELATYSFIIKKRFALINWARSANSIQRLVRAMNPWPVAFTFLNDRIFKIYDIKVIENYSKNENFGNIMKTKNSINVKCGIGTIELLDVQIESKKVMSAMDFFRGYKANSSTFKMSINQDLLDESAPTNLLYF